MEREDVEGGWGMKLQRWYIPGSDSEDAGWDDDGDWCRTEDVAELEAENETLHAEIKRLKAPPKILSAEEVTEPGWYWWTPGDVGTIEIVEVDYEYAPGHQKRLVFFEVGKDIPFPLSGQFIGPLAPPEM